jgi:AmmeMemoRadiSam system protein B
MSTRVDSDEHSLELHLPYIYHIFSVYHEQEKHPPLVPILVGNTSPSVERAFGAILAPYLADPDNVFVISSDFCHWGSRFSYTYYLPSATSDSAEGVSLKSRDKPRDPPVYESIARIDQLAMESVESGQHDAFLATLRDTGNTVCGRHPIGVMMAAIGVLKSEGKIDQDKGRFNFVRYERSSDVHDGSDSSVSYASAFAIL